MKHPINETLERLLLDGCRTIKVDSINYKISDGDITHLLLECPKDYRKDRDHIGENRPAKFISVEVSDIVFGWYESTYYYSTKSHALKSFYNRLTEDRLYNIGIKRNKVKD